MRVRRLLGLTGPFLLLVAAGCSQDEPFAGSDIAPTATPSVSITPLATPPIGSRVVEDSGICIAVPGEWEEARRDVKDGRILRWSQPVEGGPPTQAVSIVIDAAPSESLLEQSYRLEQRQREEGRQVTRSVVTRPDIETPGVLVQWEEGSRGDQQRRTVWQLMLPGKGGEIVNVVGYAPTSDFVTSRVPTVLGTVRLTS